MLVRRMLYIKVKEARTKICFKHVHVLRIGPLKDMDAKILICTVIWIEPRLNSKYRV